MHRRFGTAIVFLIVIALVFVPGLLDRIAAFLIIGVVPYTSITLAPTVMLIFYAVLLAVGIYAIANELFVASNPVKREVKSREKARRKVHKLVKTPKTKTVVRPKKRYQSIAEH